MTSPSPHTDKTSSAAAAVEGAPLLQLKNVSKRFPGVLALDRVSFDLRPGEVHVLFGENGAGKSTMISMIAGVYKPTEGEIWFRGEPVELASVHHARSLGISAVFQEFSLVGQLSVEQNLFLGEIRRREGCQSHKQTRPQGGTTSLRRCGLKLGRRYGQSDHPQRCLISIYPCCVVRHRDPECGTCAFSAPSAGLQGRFQLRPIPMVVHLFRRFRRIRRR